MIIGLCGYARSGKDTLGQVLVEKHGFTRYAFADKVRVAALMVNPWIAQRFGKIELATLVDAIGWEAAKEFADVRGFLQRLGTGMRDAVDENVWLDAVIRQIAEESPEHAVVTDVRFPNEAAWIEQVGYLVRVTRPGVGPANGHDSETAIDHVPAYEFVNGGGLEDLHFYGLRLPHQLQETR